MISYLKCDEDTIKGLEWAEGKVILDVKINKEDVLALTFEEDKLFLFDDGQIYWECRYLHTDDDLSSFTGATFVSAELREAPCVIGEKVHEVQFLLINTSLGVITIETHNEHNGYYGGFDVVVRRGRYHKHI